MKNVLILFCVCAVVLCGSLCLAAEHAEDAGGHGATAGEFDPAKQLNPLSWGKTQTDTALWTAVVFVILCVILGKFAFGPIVKALDQREQAVADNITGAEKANLDAKELLGQYRQKLVDAQDEVRQILDAGKKEAEAASFAILEKAKAASEAERVRATKEIEAATVGALQELAAKSATLATDLAGKIIKTKIDPNAHRSLIDQALRDFTKS